MENSQTEFVNYQKVYVVFYIPTTGQVFTSISYVCSIRDEEIMIQEGFVFKKDEINNYTTIVEDKEGNDLKLTLLKSKEDIDTYIDQINTFNSMAVYAKDIQEIK